MVRKVLFVLVLLFAVGVAERLDIFPRQKVEASAQVQIPPSPLPEATPTPPARPETAAPSTDPTPTPIPDPEPTPEPVADGLVREIFAGTEIVKPEDSAFSAMELFKMADKAQKHVELAINAGRPPRPDMGNPAFWYRARQVKVLVTKEEAKRISLSIKYSREQAEGLVSQVVVAHFEQSGGIWILSGVQ